MKTEAFKRQTHQMENSPQEVLNPWIVQKAYDNSWIIQKDDYNFLGRKQIRLSTFKYWTGPLTNVNHKAHFY